MSKKTRRGTNWPSSHAEEDEEWLWPVEYKPSLKDGLPRSLDGSVVRITSVLQLIRALGGFWWGDGAGTTRCPVCHQEGLHITQQSGIGIFVFCCRGKCDPVAIHKALRDLGLAIAELWLQP